MADMNQIRAAFKDMFEVPGPVEANAHMALASLVAAKVTMDFRKDAIPPKIGMLGIAGYMVNAALIGQVSFDDMVAYLKFVWEQMDNEKSRETIAAFDKAFTARQN